MGAPVVAFPDGCCDSCCSCPIQRAYFDPEYVLLFTRGVAAPPLVTTGPTTGIGAVGDRGTMVLFPTNRLQADNFSGFQARAGVWLGEQGRVGIQIGGMFVGQETVTYGIASSPAGVPILARPFTNANTNTPASMFVAQPGQIAGSVTVAAPTRFWTGDGSIAFAVRDCRPLRVHLLAGFRYYGLNDELIVTSQSQLIGNATAPVGGVILNAPTVITVTDRFAAQTNFYGPQTGIDLEWNRRRFTARLSSKVALGVSDQRLVQSGSTTGGGLWFPAGLLVTATNTGVSVTDRFAVLTDNQLVLGYQWTKWLSATIGYNFTYLSSVARAADQIDTSINPNTVPASATFGTPGGAGSPAMRNNSTDFWTQGVTFGVAVRY
jgi:hypothetical protein